MNLLLTFQKINTFSHYLFFSSFEMNGHYAKLSLSKHKHFWKVRGQKLFSVIFYTIRQPVTWTQYSRKIDCASERFFSNAIIYSSHTAPKLCFHQEGPGPFAQCETLPYCTTYLTTYFWAHLYACKCRFLSPGEPTGILWSDSSYP